MFRILAFYQFLNFNEQKVAALKLALEQTAERLGIRGLIVIGNEGINGTIAAPAESEAEFKTFLAQSLEAELDYKESLSPTLPFKRFKVDIRPELITFKRDDITVKGEGYLSPTEWQQILETDPDCVVMDVRNRYETAIGKFRDAIDPQIEKFSDFPKYLDSQKLPTDKKYLMYCTGGIRCEKAIEEMKARGFENVFQLHGGILRYLEELPNKNFEGECFVFDHRVSLDQELNPSTRYKLCPHCGDAGDCSIHCKECGKAAVICNRCREISHKQACSKNCAHHIQRKAAKSVAVA